MLVPVVLESDPSPASVQETVPTKLWAVNEVAASPAVTVGVSGLIVWMGRTVILETSVLPAALAVTVTVD